jgi:hypothetical protein
MSRLYKRGCKVTVWQTKPAGFVGANPDFFETQSNAIEITGLRVQFTVTKSLDSTPNEAEMTITNASDRTRGFIETKPLAVKIDAGYDDVLRHVFTGDVRWAQSAIDVVDWETKLQLADGDRAYRSARVSTAYKKGATVVQALREAAKAMGLQLPASVVASADLQAQFASGRSLQGPARDELTKLLAPFGYHWSIQDGKLQVLKDQNGNATEAIAVNQTTGMIGSPVYGTPDKSGKPPTLTVKMLLYPEVVPGGQILVSSRQINGVFRVSKATHTGDTHGDDWTTEVEATPTTLVQA